MEITVLNGFKPLFVERNTVYAWHNGALHKSNDHGLTFQQHKNYHNGVTDTLTNKSDLLNRILRGGVQDLIHLEDNAYIATARKAIIYARDEDFLAVHKITRGTRPLSLCSFNGNIYFGEYFNNKSRSHVDIYTSEDGINWSVVYRFKPGSIRHVHSIIRDKYRNGLWVLTGDSDRESAIWFTDDNFRTLEPILKDSQHARAVSVIPTKESLIVPMDSPTQNNYISTYDFTSRQLMRGQRVESSIFYAKQVGDLYFASTAAEPSKANNQSEAILYASIDGIKWHIIFRSRKDLYSSLSTKLFQYPTIAIPNIYNSEYLYCYCRSTLEYNNCMLRISLDDIRAEIELQSHQELSR